MTPHPINEYDTPIYFTKTGAKTAPATALITIVILIPTIL